MMKRILFAMLLLIAGPGLAQTWDGAGEQVRTWTVTPTNPTGAVGADAIEPADVSDSGFTESAWISTTDGTTDYVQPVGERKFRITCEPGTAKILDPILFAGVAPPVGHRHQGTGNIGWDQNSTFATLRSAPSATCSGGPLNGTIYWEPEVLKPLPSGVVAGIRPNLNTFYYINGNQGESQDLTWLRRNFGFIGGVNPNDYNDTARRAEYAAAAFQYPGTTDTPPGFAGWECFDKADLGAPITVTHNASRMKSSTTGAEVTIFARHLKAPDGSDPWGGSCTGENGNPGLLILNLSAPKCWDGENLRSPDGRGHVAYAARKADNSINGACPDGWAKLPRLQAKTEYLHAGFADYGQWYLGSDRMRMASTECPDAAAPCDGVSGGNVPATVGGVSYSRVSKDPCRATGLDFCNGATAHFDWIHGWKSAIADEWQRECLGITVRGVAPVNGPAECNTSQISKFRKMKYGGASPDPAMSGGCAVINSCSAATPGNIERYNPIPEGTEGDFTIIHDHGG
jgi:hypothetical protein